MKFLVENYASVEDTQALYFVHHLNSDTEHRAQLWQSNSSLYDILDTTKPDYFVTHLYKLSKDFSHYIDETKSNIRLLVSLNSVPQNLISQIEDTLLDKNLNCEFAFSSNINLKTKKLKLIQINNCYDINLKSDINIDYKVDKAIFISSSNQITKEEGSYHFISNNEDMKDIADIVLPETNMSKVYKNYDEIIFRNITDHIPQSFFDAVALGNKAYYESDNDSVHEMFSKLFKIDGSLNYRDQNKIVDFSELKSLISSKHTGSNRTKTLLSQLSKDQI